MVVDTSFKVTYGPPMSVLLKKRAWNRQVQQPAWKATGLAWNRRFKRKHFTEEGAAEYGYATRAVGYVAKKRRRLGHADPLTYSGELRRNVRSVSIRATSKSVKVRLLGSRKANLRHPREKANKADELRTISETEAFLLAREWDSGAGKAIRRTTGTETKTIT